MLAIILGAATTVGVSWQIARGWVGLIMPAAPSYSWSAADGAKWMYMTNQWPGGEERIGVLADERASQRIRAVPVQPPPRWSRFANPLGPPLEMCEQATGWPMLALASTQVPGRRTAQVQRLEGIDLGPPPASRFGRGVVVLHRMLPTRPLWPGFAVNSLLCTALWWIVLAMLVWVIRIIHRWPARRRVKRGRCPNCGYDLRGKLDAGCSECGWKRAASAVSST